VDIHNDTQIRGTPLHLNQQSAIDNRQSSPAFGCGSAALC